MKTRAASRPAAGKCGQYPAGYRTDDWVRPIDLPGTNLPGLVGDPDGESADGHGVKLELLNQSLEVAHQPGIKHIGIGGRFPEAAPRDRALWAGACGGLAGRDRR